MKRPKHRIIEMPEVCDPSHENLRRQLSILAPLRQHRLDRSDRELRKAKQRLDSTIDQEKIAQTALVKLHHDIKTEREDILQSNLKTRMNIKDLQSWAATERRLTKLVENEQEKCLQLQQQRNQQKAEVENSRHTRNRADVAVQRLAFMQDYVESLTL